MLDSLAMFSYQKYPFDNYFRCTGRERRVVNQAATQKLCTQIDTYNLVSRISSLPLIHKNASTFTQISNCLSRRDFSATSSANYCLEASPVYEKSLSYSFVSGDLKPHYRGRKCKFNPKIWRDLAYTSITVTQQLLPSRICMTAAKTGYLDINNSPMHSDNCASRESRALNRTFNYYPLPKSLTRKISQP